MSLASVHDRAFGPLLGHIRRLQRQAEPAFRSAVEDSRHRVVGHLNDTCEAEGLGRPVATWAHQGGIQIGVPEDHPDVDAIWDREYGSVGAAPAPVFGSWARRHRGEMDAGFEASFHRAFLHGTPWGRR